MDRLDSKSDDLFENSTMTFREHLAELRECLVKASIWLAIGVAVGFAFASPLVQYVKKPLEVAIHQFNSERGLARLGVEDTEAEHRKPLVDALADRALVAEEAYILPPELFETFERAIASEPQYDEERNLKRDADVEAIADFFSTGDSQIIFRNQETNVSSFEISETFMIWFKAALVIGAVLSAPMVFYHLWSFVAAGLHAHERKYVQVYLPISVTLFVSGVLMAFYVVLKYVIAFLLNFNASMDIAFEPRLNYYIGFVLLLPLGFGVAFQLPLVMLFLQRIGLFETEAYTSSWRVAVVVIFVISMLLTPADWTSMVLLAVPLVFLYLLGILMCRFLPRGRGMGSGAYDPA